MYIKRFCLQNKRPVELLFSEDNNIHPSCPFLLFLKEFKTKCSTTCLVRTQDIKEDRIGGLNLYQGDDASEILQEAFAQAGIDLGGPITPIASTPQTKRPSLMQRLKNLKLPSLPTLTRRKVTPMPSNVLIPIVSNAASFVPKVGRGLTSSKVQQQMPIRVKETTFVPQQQYSSSKSQHHAALNPTYTFPKQVQEVVKEIQTVPQALSQSLPSETSHSPKATVSDEPAVVKPAVLTPLPIRVDKQILSNKKTIDNSFKNFWTPSASYFGGFKPIPATSSNQRPVTMSSSPIKGSKDYEKSTSLSGEVSEETKRVSFYESLDQEKSAIIQSKNGFKQTTKSTDLWNMNHSPSSQGDATTSRSKLFPISQNVLLEQLAKMNSSRSSEDCENKDLGWCDYSDSYPEHFVLAVIKECRDVIERMYVEVPQNLAEFDDYVPFSPDSSRGKDRGATWSWAGYRNKNNALCDSDRKFVRPSVAQDITGRWFVIVQSSLYHQQIPIELCRSPGGVCNNISECGLSARCVQKFNTQLLVSIDLDKDSDCPSMRLYRFPSGCVCDNASYYQ